MCKNLFWFLLIAPAVCEYDGVWSDLSEVLKVPNVKDKLANLRDGNVHPTCSEHVRHYLSSLEKEWAQKMFDSIEKTPFGILHGRTTFFGNFDECLESFTSDFKGKHCMVNIAVEIENPNTETKQILPLFYGICLPSTCNASDIESAAAGLGLPEQINITADDKNCWTTDGLPLATEDCVVIAFLGSITLIAVCSTIFDVMHRKKYITAKRHELLSSFSLYKNCEQLVRIHTGNISCLNGVRTLTMFWIILCHEFVMPIFSSPLNGAVIQSFIVNKQKIPIVNGFVSVDTFFLLSGLLVAFVFFRDIGKKGSYDVPVAMIHRFIRITPAYAAMVLLQSTIILKLGSGPSWNKNIGHTAKVCRENWWYGLLYVQNIFKPTSSCLGQSWYLSSDMQMFWLSPILLYPLLMWPKKGLIFYFAGLATALAMNFGISYNFGLGPHMFLTPSPRQFDTDYVQTHMRLTPYVVGMGLGYIICGVKANKIRVNISQMWVLFGWMMSAALCLGSMYGISYFIDNKENSVLLSSSYLTFHRLGWSLGLAWIIFACIVGYGGPVDKILSWDGFQVLGKLSYCLFLVHFSIQMCKIGLLRTNYYIHDFFIVSSFLSTLLLAIMFAVPLYLLFEAPFSNLDKYFLRDLVLLPYPKRKTEKIPNATSLDEIKISSVEEVKARRLDTGRTSR